jgi:hypothetical protein
MAGRLLCFTLGAILPLASVSWLIAFHQSWRGAPAQSQPLVLKYSSGPMALNAMSPSPHA